MLLLFISFIWIGILRLLEFVPLRRDFSALTFRIGVGRASASVYKEILSRQGATWSQVQGRSFFSKWLWIGGLLFLLTICFDWGEGSASAVKSHGSEPEWVSGPHSYAKQPCKRSFRRAQLRIHRFGFTWYKGQLLTKSQIAPSWTPPSMKPATFSKNATPPQPHCRKRLMSFSWNAGGLAPARWDLLQQWAEAQELDVLCVQETHWPYDSEWQTPSYHCIHSGIMATRPGFYV